MAPRKSTAPEPQPTPIEASPFKKAKLDEPSEDLMHVLAVLNKGHSSCPEAARTMLAEALPHAATMCTSGAARHKYQEEILVIARKVLHDDAGIARECRTSCQERLSEAEDHLKSFQAVRDERIAAVTAAQTVRDEKIAAVAALARKVQDAQLAQADAEAVVKPVLALLKQAEEERAKVAKIAEGVLQAGAARALNASDVTKVEKALVDFQVESALIAAARGALIRKPEERGGFDKITVESIDEVVDAKLHELDSKVANARPVVEEEKAMGLGLWAIWDLARARQTEATQAVEVAEAELETAVTAEKAAIKDVEAHSPTIGQIKRDVAVHDGVVADLEVACKALAQLVATEDAAAGASAGA
jgi:hypothetical protein